MVRATEDQNTRRRQHHGVRKICKCPRWDTCRHPWHFNYTPPYGRPHRGSLDRELRRHVVSHAEAVKEAAKIRAAIDAGTFHQVTIRTVAAKYLTRHVRVPTRRIRAREDIEYQVKRIVEQFGHQNMPPSKADVEAWRDAMRAANEAQRRVGDKGGEVGINRLLTRLRALCGWAIKEGFAAETPFRRHGVPLIALNDAAEEPRARRLESGEEARLLDVASVLVRGLIIATLYTGCAIGELLDLQWRQIEDDWIALPAGRLHARFLQIHPLLQSELSRRRGASQGPYVFGNDWGGRRVTIATAWHQTCERADIAGLRFHDLRREFAARSIEDGASWHDVAELLGHDSESTTRQYLSKTPLRLDRMRRLG
jgi:integrase